MAETLEIRLCFSAIRVVSWNTENGPDNNATDIDSFTTVFRAIGGESVAGNSIAPGIIALQETDTAEFGGNSIARVESILEAVFPQTNYDFAVSPLDTGDDANGFVFDTAVFELVSTRVVEETPGMTAFAHNIFRGQFRPRGSTAESDFYIYSTHLKAGGGGNDSSRRTAEANAIRVDIDALGDGTEVLVMGDFNIGGASEGAYRNFLAGGAGQLFDPINRPGEWKNDGAFLDIHTQNPEINGAGGMDDRFDFQLASGEVFDDVGLRYLPGTYHAFGNNGTHRLNDDITTGSGASPQVLLALARASDHLPVVVDYEISPSANGYSIVETDGSTTVSEAGGTDSYSIVLNSVPTSNVTIDLTTDSQILVNDQSETSLTFTPQNALTPQVILVRALPDAIAEGTTTSLVTHVASSADTNFSGSGALTLAVTVLDDDTPTVLISEIMYDSFTTEPEGEWVEIVNRGPGSVDISGWQLDDEDSTDWAPLPTGISPLAVGATAIIHNAVISSTAFRNAWSIPAIVPVIGVAWGSLANGPSSTNEILQLLDAGGSLIDQVNYENGGGWPSRDNGPSIYLTDLFADNDLGSSWRLSQRGVDGAYSPSGSPLSDGDVGSPGVVPSFDVTPPTIVDVKVAGSSWSAAHLAEIDPTGSVGFSLPGPGQLRNLPWTNLDTISIKFSENISSFTAADFALVGTNIGDYSEKIESVAYDAATFTATIRSKSPLSVDAIRLIVFDSVRDELGNLLDGDWSDSVSLVSGDGVAGGDFLFRVDLLPGDYRDTGVVSISDAFGIFRTISPNPSSERYDPLADLNGSGSITIGDVFLSYRQLLDRLPDAPPSAASFGPFLSLSSDSSTGNVTLFARNSKLTRASFQRGETIADHRYE